MSHYTRIKIIRYVQTLCNDVCLHKLKKNNYWAKILIITGGPTIDLHLDSLGNLY